MLLSSPLAPLEPVVLAEVLAQAGVPAGVYNVVQGEGQTGALLSGNQVPQPSLISYQPSSSRIWISSLSPEAYPLEAKLWLPVLLG